LASRGGGGVYRDKVWVERGMAWDSMQLFSLTSRTNLARNTTQRETFQAFFFSLHRQLRHNSSIFYST
jgi:hypothetical protein